MVRFCIDKAERTYDSYAVSPVSDGECIKSTNSFDIISHYEAVLDSDQNMENILEDGVIWHPEIRV